MASGYGRSRKVDDVHFTLKFGTAPLIRHYNTVLININLKLKLSAVVSIILYYAMYIQYMLLVLY